MSIVALVAGGVVVAGLLGARIRSFWTNLFLVTAVATSASGFGFPFTHLLPSYMVAIVALAIAIVARRSLLAGAWRWIYALGMVASLYLLVFVLVAQAFGKVPVLRALAPTQSEPPFAVSQAVVLLAFVVIGIAAARIFRPRAVPA